MFSRAHLDRGGGAQGAAQFAGRRAILSGVMGLEMNASMPARRQASLFRSEEWAVVAMMIVRRVGGLDGPVARRDLGADQPGRFQSRKATS